MMTLMKSGAFTAITLLIVLITSRLWALDDISTAAERAVDLGLAAAEQGQWPAAIGHFEAAQREAPFSPHVLYDLALANDKAGGRELLAIAWFHAFLAVAPESPVSEQVRRRIKQLESGAKSNILRLLRIDKEMTATLPESYRDNEYWQIGEALARAGDTIGAKDTASRLTPEGNYYLIKISTMIAEVGDIIGAKEIAAMIRDPSNRDQALMAIVKAQTRVADFDAAIETARGIAQDDYRPLSYLDIVRAQAKLGDMDAADATSKLMGKDRHWAYKEIAVIKAETGDIEGAMESAKRVSTDLEKYEAYLTIAVAQYASGDLDGARATFTKVAKMIEKTKDRGLRPYGYCYLGREQLGVGETEAARETADLARDAAARLKDDRELPFFGYTKYDALIQVADLYHRLGKEDASRESFSKAKRAVEALKQDRDRSSAYRSIAIAQAKVGDLDAGRESFALSRAAAARIPVSSGSDRFFSLDYLAAGQAEAGDFEGAKETAARIEDDFYMSDAYSKIAIAEARAGKIADARETAKKLTNDDHKYEAFKSIAMAQASIGSTPTDLIDLARALSKEDILVDFPGYLRGIKEWYVTVPRALIVTSARMEDTLRFYRQRSDQSPVEHRINR